MDDCTCSKQEDITVLNVTQKRVLKLLEGNGHPSLDVRLSKIDTMETEVREILTSQEILRKTVAGFVEAEKFITQQKRTALQEKRDRVKNTLKLIGIFCVVIGLAYEIFFK